MTTLDQKLVKTTPSDVQTQKKEPLKFAWMKNEFAILVCIGVVWYSYILIDLALLMRYLITNKDIKIHGLSPGYFGIPKVICIFVAINHIFTRIQMIVNGIIGERTSMY